ncbi:GM14978 [Drosophila sechellia]|uniref:GM14978 n=1 Tax=Drosophila sechellia TaxID=7238 RepID=B4IFT1_DROSE|nr:GM14978 [Drosophila sechellia]
MLNVVRAAVLLILVQSINSTDPNDLFNRKYYSSSVLGLVKLLKMEQAFMENFSMYANILQEKVDNLNIFLDALKRPNHITHNEREKFVSNPLNAFGLIRRLNQDWPKLQNYTQKPLGLVQLTAMQDIVSAAPESFDMNEKLKAMHRIETTYDLQPKDIAKGLLQSTEFIYKLSFRDCLSLAHHKFEIGEFKRSLLWFREALKLNADGSLEIMNILQEIELKGFATAVAKRVSIYLSNQALTNETIDNMVNTQLQDAKQMDLEQLISSELKQWINDDSTTPPTGHNLGCQGLFPKKSNLVCRYNSSTNAFLQLAPLKMEEVSRDPYIVMFHEVVSDKEIEEMKGEITEMENGKESSFSKRINQRISDMTGFKLEEFPAIQSANFGVGGYFKPHYDYYTDRLKEVDVNNTLGDRIGSIIFYAGEVSQGGQTVFPDSKVMVEPKKGNALLWFNAFIHRQIHEPCTPCVQL